MSITELLDRYGSDMEDGLTEAQAAEALQRDGPNVLTPPRQMPGIVKFLLQMFGGFSALLWLGALLCFFSYGVEKGTKGDGVSDDNVSQPSCAQVHPPHTLNHTSLTSCGAVVALKQIHTHSRVRVLCCGRCKGEYMDEISHCSNVCIHFTCITKSYRLVASSPPLPFFLPVLPFPPLLSLSPFLSFPSLPSSPILPSCPSLPFPPLLFSLPVLPFPCLPLPSPPPRCTWALHWQLW